MPLRIIGGELRGKRLAPVRGSLTRPTSDRLRESIFNILADRVRNAIVLDLFAGTGALGIEAISRGAASAVFIDCHREALTMISRNVQDCRLQDRTKIIKWDISKSLNCLRSFQSEFNLVFMDPPYSENLVLRTLDNLVRSGALALHAEVIVEHAPTDAVPIWPARLELQDQRRYGKSLVSFLEYVI